MTSKVRVAERGFADAVPIAFGAEGAAPCPVSKLAPMPVAPRGLAGFQPNGRSFYAFREPYVAYATPTDMLSLRNPAGSGKIILPRVMSLLCGSTAAALMKFYWYRRTALNTGGTPTDIVPVKYDSALAVAAGVPRVYGAGPVIVDAASPINVLLASTTALAAAPTNFNSSGGSFGWSLNAMDFATPLVLHPGEEIAMNLAGAALPAGFTSIAQLSWIEYDA